MEEKTAFQKYTDKKRLSQLALHNFEVANERKEAKGNLKQQ